MLLPGKWAETIQSRRTVVRRPVTDPAFWSCGLYYSSEYGDLTETTCANKTPHNASAALGNQLLFMSVPVVVRVGLQKSLTALRYHLALSGAVPSA
jgi:hypothetical protein